MSVIRKNIFWLLLSQGATWVATLATLLIVPNKLGSEDFGTYGFAVGYVQFFILVAGLGTSMYLSRAVARDHTILGVYIWNAVLLKVLLWAALSVAAIGVAYALGNRGETLLIIVISCVGMLPYLLTEVFVGGLAGLQQMARPAAWMVGQVYFQTVFGILVLLLGWGLIAYTVVMTIGIFIPAVATAVMVRTHVRGHRTFDPKIWRLLVVGGIPLLTLTFLNMIYGSIDVPILHSLVGSDPVAWYVVALRWASIPVFITTAVVGAYFPAFSREGNPLTDEFSRLVNQALNIVLLVAIPACVGLFFVADDLIHLFYSDGYDEAIPLVQILAIGIPIMGMDTVLGTALVASDSLKRYLWVAATASVLNPILCVVAIKVTDDWYSNGAIGAAVMTVATEVYVMLGALRLRAPGVVDRHEVGRIVRITAAAAAMVPVLVLTTSLPLAVAVVAGAAAYAVASLLFGSLPMSEIRDIVQRFRSSRSGEGPVEGPDDEAEVDYAAIPPTDERPPFP